MSVCGEREREREGGGGGGGKEQAQTCIDIMWIHFFGNIFLSIIKLFVKKCNFFDEIMIISFHCRTWKMNIFIISIVCFKFKNRKVVP